MQATLRQAHRAATPKKCACKNFGGLLPAQLRCFVLRWHYWWFGEPVLTTCCDGIFTDYWASYPLYICTEGANVSIQKVVETYCGDLPSPELVEIEVTRWKAMFQCLRSEDRPATLAAAMKECDQVTSPNLHTLLRIASMLPVTSCKCECSACALCIYATTAFPQIKNYSISSNKKLLYFLK